MRSLLLDLEVVVELLLVVLEEEVGLLAHEALLGHGRLAVPHRPLVRALAHQKARRHSA